MQKLVLLGLFLLVACSPIPSSQDGIDEEGKLIEISDLYSAGHDQLESALVNQPAVGRMLDSNLAATLLITLTIEYEDGEKERVQQSGSFIFNGEYILTAGHGFFVDSGKLIGLEAQTISRQKLDLNVVALRKSRDDYSIQDWAILQPVNPRRTKSLEIVPSRYSGEDAYILGFPGGMALNDSNWVVHALEVDEGAVYPLAVICERSLTRPGIITPKVGAIPVQGMSGAPVLSENGQLIGLFSSISRTRNVTGWQYIFHMSDLPFETLDSLLTK
ncbi:MAG: trypsin-like peptidase domain-containing protein [FCB group bacterium]|nr:trypsin-like peptidase domain-containing protein [FCB group bacterium]MBL7028679.1 trypsin-like peptidase domain-containing protein [Candidatus Neomarinimicrobiota bacterium]MBL7121747.1 trypsin-like peptidase domain-containing protein [Candidatus Neomarinimicrobiota bacterium]